MRSSICDLNKRLDKVKFRGVGSKPGLRWWFNHQEDLKAVVFCAAASTVQPLFVLKLFFPSLRFMLKV